MSEERGFYGPSNAALVAASRDSYPPRPRPEYGKAWLDKRRPCWICNLSLMRMQSGPHKGKYVAAVIEEGGHERHCHLACVEEIYG